MSNIVSGAVGVVLGLFSFLVLAYSLIIAQQLLLGVLAVGVIWVAYLLYLLIVEQRSDSVGS